MHLTLPEKKVHSIKYGKNEVNYNLRRSTYTMILAGGAQYNVITLAGVLLL